MNHRIPRGWWVSIPLGLGLLVLAHLMALLFRVQPAVSLWFPPSGVAIALSVWFGPVGVLLTGFTAMLVAPWWGNDGWLRLAGWTDATEPLVAWWLYRYYWQGSRSLQRFQDAVAFIISAPLLACGASALFGSFTLALLGKIPAENLHTVIPHWWLGNAMGTMAIAPVALLTLTPILQKRGWLNRSQPSHPQTDSHHTPTPTQQPQSKTAARPLRYWLEILFIIAFTTATATFTVSRAEGTNFTFQQYSFLNFLTVIWTTTRFGVVGGTLTASLSVLSTLISYLVAYPNAISLPSFPVHPEVLHVHKLSLLLQCIVSLLLGTAFAETAATQVTLAVERVRLAEYQARTALLDQLAELNTFLETANAHLQQSNLEKNELLQREQSARAEAETANRMKDEFLAVLSHELRTPLNPILGWLQLLQNRKYDEATTTRAIDIIHRNAKLQSQLVEDLLDVSRILRGELSLNANTVNIEYTIKAALETVQLAATAKSITINFKIIAPALEIQRKLLVLGDENRLQQVVSNLLNNAVKFTPAGGRVEVELSLSCELNQPDSVIIQVSDTGKGISPDFLPYVFERFRQADSSITRKFGGLGLGLAIVRHIVELHGGTVVASSLGENQGATFTVKLPLQLPNQNSAASAIPNTVNS